jgi:Fe-Mn family superoxide dismutase
LALDVFEHAYFIDFGTRKADYIDAFFRNLDWDDVADRYETARRIAPNAPRLGVNFAS